MSNLEVHQKVQSYIEQLSPEKLLVAADFLAYLVEREDTEATSEDEHQFWENSSQISVVVYRGCLELRQPTKKPGSRRFNIRGEKK